MFQSTPSLIPDGGSQSQASTLTDTSISSKSSSEEVLCGESPLWLRDCPTRNENDGQYLDEWELHLSDTSEESPEKASLNHDRFLDQGSSDQSSSISPADPQGLNDMTPPERTPESEPDPGSSQEQSSFESRDGEEWSQNQDSQCSQERNYRDRYDYREKPEGDQDEEYIDDEIGFDQESQEEIELPESKRIRLDDSVVELSSPDTSANSFVHKAASSKRALSFGNEVFDDQGRRHERSSRGDVSHTEFKNQEPKDRAFKKRTIPKKKRNKKQKYSNQSLRKERKPSEFEVSDCSFPERTDSGNFADECIGTKRRTPVRSDLRERFARNLANEEETFAELSTEFENLESLYHGEEFVKSSSRKRRRISEERLREINENWNRMYGDDVPPKSKDTFIEKGPGPDSAALNVEFALAECLADTEHNITNRIPRALSVIEREEKLHKFHSDVGEDLTAICNSVESKTVAHMEKLKESCSHLADLDTVLIPSGSMQSTLNDLRVAANKIVSSIGKLRERKENSLVQQSFLETHIRHYLRISEEDDAQSERCGRELAELEQSRAQFEESLARGIELRTEDEDIATFSENLQTVLDTGDAMQKELELIRQRIHEQEVIVSFPDCLKVEKLVTVLREAISDLLASRGLPTCIDFDEKQLETENPAGGSDLDELIKLLEDLLKPLCRTSTSAQTILSLQHIRDLGSRIEISDDSQASSVAEESQVTNEMDQRQNEADSSGALD